FKAEGEVILLVGGHGTHLGQSVYLRDVLGREEGTPPPVDLAREKRHGDLIRSFIRSGQVTAVHDISDGGLASCLIEMALSSKTFGASVGALDHIALFAEDQARYVVTCPVREAAKIITQAHVQGVNVIRIGTVTSEAGLIVEGVASISLDKLRDAHEGWFPAYMGAKAA
ncbi:MAG: phosphoribosylformylglycinamidine synthase II, partial [Alphaproteobacteria bacterium]